MEDTDWETLSNDLGLNSEEKEELARELISIGQYQKALTEAQEMAHVKFNPPPQTPQEWERYNQFIVNAVELLLGIPKKEESSN